MNLEARRIAAAIFVAGFAVLAACRSVSSPPAANVPAYLIAPRTGVPGPYPHAAARAWSNLVRGRIDKARLLLGEIPPGLIHETLAIQCDLQAERFQAARDLCDQALASGGDSAALLAACGQTRARLGDWVRAHELFLAASVRLPRNSPLAALVLFSAPPAVVLLVTRGDQALVGGDANQALADARRALMVSPGNVPALVLEARADRALGRRGEALERLLEAWKRKPDDTELGVQTGDLALETGDDAVASEVFHDLARRDPAFATRARRADEEFAISNWPPSAREAARATRLTRAQACDILWRLVPELRGVKALPASPSEIASDLLGRADETELVRLAALGVLTVDPVTHQAFPGRFLKLSDAVRMLWRTSELVPRLSRGEAGACFARERRRTRGILAPARACGILPAAEARFLSGAEFRQALRTLSGPTEPLS